MKAITLMLCCVFIAGCASMVETYGPEVGRDVPRGHEPSPSDYAYARAYRHKLSLYNTMEQKDVLAMNVEKSRSEYTAYADAGLQAKYATDMHYTRRYAGEMMNMSQASRARAEIDAYRRIMTNIEWAAYHHDAKASDDIRLGLSLDR